jgi:hypothetical protein
MWQQKPSNRIVVGSFYYATTNTPSYTLGWHSAPLSLAPHPDELRLWERIFNTVHPHQPLGYRQSVFF